VTRHGRFHPSRRRTRIAPTSTCPSHLQDTPHTTFGRAMRCMCHHCSCAAGPRHSTRPGHRKQRPCGLCRPRPRGWSTTRWAHLSGCPPRPRSTPWRFRRVSRCRSSTLRCRSTQGCKGPSRRRCPSQQRCRSALHMGKRQRVPSSGANAWGDSWRLTLPLDKVQYRATPTRWTGCQSRSACRAVCPDCAQPRAIAGGQPKGTAVHPGGARRRRSGPGWTVRPRGAVGGTHGASGDVPSVLPGVALAASNHPTQAVRSWRTGNRGVGDAACWAGVPRAAGPCAVVAGQARHRTVGPTVAQSVAVRGGQALHRTIPSGRTGCAHPCTTEAKGPWRAQGCCGVGGPRWASEPSGAVSRAGWRRYTWSATKGPRRTRPTARRRAQGTPCPKRASDTQRACPCTTQAVFTRATRHCSGAGRSSWARVPRGAVPRAGGRG
jgi:hypothetical protein